ncbi:MAG: thioredoxin domain-containing protein, partial [Chloroflexota bacterium]
MPNRLAQESSPYLLQHANNPVEWYPWGDEALERARAENKPILLSIGYSACHWCHVMAHESFEDAEIAGLMNRSFINIKVDREERPDLDSTYMAAVQALTQRGGWPMTVFLTPEGVPFYGGTYYPPEDRLGLPGFPRVLAAVADAYANRRDEVLRGGAALVEQLRHGPERTPATSTRLDPNVIREAAEHLRQYFDAAHGGFGGAPKFPQPMVLDFLLHACHLRPDPALLDMVELTLGNMARGGMYDQLGGGFHRYSTDRVWLVPHFEKMLYDNAQLALVYLHAYQLTKRSLYRRVAEDTLDYVMREMVLPEGGFASTQDADSEGHEGQFFVWALDEIEALLPAPAAGWFAQAYGVTRAGNWEGRNILHLVADAAELAARAGEQASAIEISAALEDGRRRLFAQRETRVKPGLDDKALASWNALMLKAFAEGAAVLGRADYARVARRGAEFALQHLMREGQVLRTCRHGQAKLPGYLEDYAALADAFLTLYETTLETRWFAEANALATALVDDFWDAASQTFADTGRHHEALFTRPRDVFD